MNCRLLLAVVLLLGLVGVLWLAARGRGTEVQDPVAPCAAATGSSEPEAASAPLAPAGGTRDEAADEQELDVPEEASRDMRVVLSTTVKGRVVIPEGTPADEEIEVVLLTRRPEGDEAQSSRRFGGEWEERTRSAVGSNGHFELHLPPGWDVARLRLDATYLSLPFYKSIREWSDSVVLKPELRGAVRFRLVPAPGLRGDPRALVGREARLEFSAIGQMSGPPNYRPITIDENLEMLAGALNEEISYYLEGDFPPFAPFPSICVCVPPGELRVVEVPLLDRLVVGGRVVDEDGAPIESALILAGIRNKGEDSWAAPWQDASTDESGVFRIENLDPRATTIEVTETGFLRAELPMSRVLADGGGLDYEVRLSRGAWITGSVVLPDGRPVAGAYVICTPAGEDDRYSGGKRREGTDETGRFAISGLRPRAYDLSTSIVLDDPETIDARHAVVRRAEDLRKGYPWIARRSAVVAGGGDVDLVLVPPPGLEGRVVDDAGEPVTRFRLEAEEDRGHSVGEDTFFFSADHRQDFEAADGTFRWRRLPVGRWLVRVEAEGYPSPRPVRIELPGDGAPVRLEVPRFGSTEGVVLDPGGQPLRRAKIYTGWIVEMSSPLGAQTPEARTDREGRFRLPEVPSGRIRLVATAPEFAPSAPQVIDVAPGERITDVTLTVGRGGFLSIRVLDEEGRPAAGREVSVYGSSAIALLERETDAGGHVEVGPLRPGRFQIHTSTKREPGSALSARARVREGETTKVTLGGRLRGEVVVQGLVTSGDRPVVEAFVEAWSEQETSRENKTKSGADGRFTLELEAGGKTLFRVVDADGGRPWYFDEQLPESGEHVVSFALPASGIAGRIEVEGGGRLPFDVQVVIEREREHGVAWAGGDAVSVHVAQDGTWSCDHLAPGSYRVVAARELLFPEHDERAPAPAVRSGIVVEAGELVEDVVLVLRPSGLIEGLVAHTDGRSCPDAVLYIREESGRLLHPFGYEVESDGRFSVSGLPTGRILVEAVGERVATAEPRAVDVEPGEVTRVDLRVFTATRIVLELRGLQEDASDVVVSLRDSAGREHAQERGSVLGWYHAARALRRGFGPLPPGRWVAEARRGDGRTAKIPFTLAGEEECTVVLDFSGR